MKTSSRCIYKLAWAKNRKKNALEEADYSKDTVRAPLAQLEFSKRIACMSKSQSETGRNFDLPESKVAGPKSDNQTNVFKSVGKLKSINGKRSEQGEQVWLGSIVGMIRGNTSKKRPREQSEQWLENEISLTSMPGCQLVDSPIILEALIEGFLVQRIYVKGGSSSEVIIVSYPIGTINLNVTIGESERLQTIPMEFPFVKSHSPYNVILGRTGLKSLGAVASTIHSMIKFPTSNGIVTMTTKKETLYECQRMEEAQGPALEGRITFSRILIPDSEGTTSTGKEESQGKIKKEGEPEDTIQPTPNPHEKDIQTYEEIEGKDEHPERSVESKPQEKVVIHDDYED
ncbi:hypothetical protein Tco_0104511 [Tanacetum coccineum]